MERGLARSAASGWLRKAGNVTGGASPKRWTGMEAACTLQPYHSSYRLPHRMSPYRASSQDAYRHFMTLAQNGSLCLSSSSSFSSSFSAFLSRRLCCTAAHSGSRTFELIQHEADEPKGVAIVRLNRPKALNALCDKLTSEMIDCLRLYDQDDKVRAIVLSGVGKAFAAGADIKEMLSRDYSKANRQDMLSAWGALQAIRKPIVAAVHGYALGGGCELAMMCDVILAGEGTKFGQPEILIGTVPGMGGSQRLTKAVGKSRAMEWILTGRQIDAKEACEAGLVSRVVPTDSLESEAVKLAEQIAKQSLPAIMAAKELVNRSFETSLQEGLLFERRVFHATFANADRVEGMTAFAEKRPPQWQHK